MTESPTLLILLFINARGCFVLVPPIPLSIAFTSMLLSRDRFCAAPSPSLALLPTHPPTPFLLASTSRTLSLLDNPHRPAVCLALKPTPPLSPPLSSQSNPPEPASLALTRLSHRWVINKSNKKQQ